MKINVCRIDDRLIHGQIVTKWIKEADAKLIIVSDDKAANDTQDCSTKWSEIRDS